MDTTHNQPPTILNRAIIATTIAAVLLAITLFALRILTHIPFYDELLHMRFLFLISDGLTPHIDFWCSYPIAGYLLTLPLFKLCPQHIYTLLALRTLMMLEFTILALLLSKHSKRITGSCIWGLIPFLCIMTMPPLSRFAAEFSIDPLAMLTAAGAISLFFQEATPKRIFLAALLSLLSVFITPKYPVPLFFGLCGYCLSYLIQQKRIISLLLTILCAIACAAMLLTFLYLVNGCSLYTNLHGAHIMMSRYNFFISEIKQNTTHLLAQSILNYAPRFPFAVLFILLGIVGWIISVIKNASPNVEAASRRFPTPLLAPTGCLLGLILFALQIHNRLEQYILPAFITLAFFTPYGSVLFSRYSLKAQQTILLLLIIATIAFQLTTIQSSCSEFKETPLTSRDAKAPGVRSGPSCLPMLNYMQQLLEMIPPEERVAAHWEAHPVYRRDLTFMTADDNPSFINVLPEHSPARTAFNPEVFRNALNQTPPAIIAPTQFPANYPPGWTDIAVEYLKANPDRYKQYSSPVDPYVFIRTDLLQP